MGFVATIPRQSHYTDMKMSIEEEAMAIGLREVPEVEALATKVWV